MERFQSKVIKEAEDDKTKEAITELIKTSWSGSDEKLGKALSLIKGIVYSETPSAKKFMKKLDDYTSSLDPDDFK